jgi:hypothetical protein
VNVIKGHKRKYLEGQRGRWTDVGGEGGRLVADFLRLVVTGIVYELVSRAGK